MLQSYFVHYTSSTSSSLLGPRIAVVGTGVAGISFLSHLDKIIKLNKSEGLSIDIYEKSREKGTGFAYSTEKSIIDHLVNMPAKDMSLPSLDLLTWCKEHKDSIQKTINNFLDKSIKNTIFPINQSINGF